MFQRVMSKLIKHENLSENEMIEIMNDIMDGNVSAIRISAFLTALRVKGETTEEITGCAKVMRQKSLSVKISDRYAIDTCGTGGDEKNTFNVSTAAAIITAAAGVTTVKHGNRSVSSKCGSADVLDELGIKIEIQPEDIEKCIESTGFGFLFAPKFHSSMKHVAPVRKELGMRTIFNMLGPLTNPGKVKIQLMGVYDKALTEPIAQVLKQLGLDRAFVLHSEDGLDEISIFAKTKVTELKDGEIKTFYIEPRDFGIKEYDFKDVLGSGITDNADIIRDILNGTKGAPREMVLINAAAAIYLGNGAKTLQKGYDIASETIDSGKALNTLNNIVSFTNGMNTL